MFAETEEVDWDDFDDGPSGRQWGDTSYESNSGEANEEIYIFFASGRIDITILAYANIEDISIVATWEEIDMPGSGPGPEPEPPTDIEIQTCDEYSDDIFEDLDLDGDGDISQYEIMFDDEEEFDEFDRNGDEVIDKSELLYILCTCENELYITMEQIDSFDYGASIEYLSAIAWKNDFDFFEMDSNNDMYIDFGEIEDYAEKCVTTFDPFEIGMEMERLMMRMHSPMIQMKIQIPMEMESVIMLTL